MDGDNLIFFPRCVFNTGPEVYSPEMMVNETKEIMEKDYNYRPSTHKAEELVIRFKLDTRECARCILGDPGLTCTCSFRHRAPDFKLYEDDEKFLNNFHTIGTYV